jgi:GxxExxY protein
MSVFNTENTEITEEELEKKEFLYSDITEKIIDGAIKVHKAVGVGVLESVYEICLCHELSSRGMKVERQVEVPIRYNGVLLEAGFRIDLLVEDKVIVEIKAVEKLLSIHEAQLLTYMRLPNKRVGLLINFNVQMLRDGIRRRVP